MFIVYCHTNKKNGHKYIGITAQTPNARWLNGKGYSRNKKFYTEIQKYGWDNFTHEILFDGLTETEAISKEAELIKKYDSVSCGYNNSYGGQYPRKSNLCHEANQIKNVIKQARHRYPAFDDVLEGFDMAEKDEVLANTINLFVEAVLNLFKENHDKISYNIDFVLDFIWEYKRIWAIHGYIHMIDNSEEAVKSFVNSYPTYKEPLEIRKQWMHEFKPFFEKALSTAV